MVTPMKDLYYEIILHTESKSFESMDDLFDQFDNLKNDWTTNAEQQEQIFHLAYNELQLRIDPQLSVIWSAMRTSDVTILSRRSFL